MGVGLHLSPKKGQRDTGGRGRKNQLEGVRYPPKKRQKIRRKSLKIQGWAHFFFCFFFGGLRRICVYYPNSLYISYFFVPLYMPWDIEIHNRISIGFALGFQYYGQDDEHNWSELTIFLGLISIVIKY